MNSKTVDINCDLGEGESLDDCLQDALLMPLISRCNIACGGHAGNTFTMQKTAENADKYGVLCGAHPGYPDPENFGRVSLSISADNLLNSVITQIEQLQSIAHSFEQPLQHIKLHGALYNDAEKSPALADILCAEFGSRYDHLCLIGLSGGGMEKAAQKHKLKFLREGFIDRAYLTTGHLSPRSIPGSVYDEPNQCIEQILAMLSSTPIKPLSTKDNQQQKSVLIEADTYCLHGDSPNALALAQHLKDQLSQRGYHIA